MKVLGVDPGPTMTGLAQLYVERGRPARIERGDNLPTASVLPWLRHAVRHRLVRLDLVVVERPQRVHGRTEQEKLAKGRDVVETAWEAGAIAGRAADLGLRVESVRARAWRSALFSRAKAFGWRRDPARDTDQNIARALGAMRLGGVADSNVHVRDAAGLGWMVAERACASEVVR